MKSPKAEKVFSKFTSFATHLSDPVIITDNLLDPPGPRILYVNNAFTRITKYSAAEVLGETPRLLQGPRTDRRVLDELRHTLKSGQKSFFGQIVNYDKEGHEITFEWHISSVCDEESNPVYWVSVMHPKSAVEVGQKNLKALLIHRNQLTGVALRSHLAQIDRSATVIEAESADAALPLLERQGPVDLVIVEWANPYNGSLADLIRLNQAIEPAPLAVLTATNEAREVPAFFELGAKAVIPTSGKSEPLSEIFRLILAGGVYIPSHITNLKHISEPVMERQPKSWPALNRLTRRQRQMLQLIAQGLSNEDIAQQLDLKLPTVKAHVSRVLRELEVKSRVQAALLYREKMENSG